jgi:anti-sigma B factor antagonist
MRLLEDTHGPIRILALGGQIDLHYAALFRKLLEHKRDTPVEALLLDLSEVTFIDSTGIGAIITYLRAATRVGTKFCIGGMSAAVKDVFEVIHLRQAMPIFETRTAALEAIGDKKLRDPTEPLFSNDPSRPRPES